jgi:hypothetical protein
MFYDWQIARVYSIAAKDEMTRDDALLFLEWLTELGFADVALLSASDLKRLWIEFQDAE